MIELLFGILIGCVIGAKCAASILPVIDGAWAKVKAKLTA